MAERGELEPCELLLPSLDVVGTQGVDQALKLVLAEFHVGERELANLVGRDVRRLARAESPADADAALAAEEDADQPAAVEQADPVECRPEALPIRGAERLERLGERLGVAS
jgi:hypothetical protein